jgi:hypothetical protein
VNPYLTKLAVKLSLYQDKQGKKRWVAEDKPVKPGETLIKTVYKKKKTSVPKS